MVIALVRLALCALIATVLAVQAGEQWLVTQVTAQISQTQVQLARPAEAAAVAERIVDLAPTASQAAFVRAQVAAQTGEYEAALAWLARCQGRIVNQARWLRTAAFAHYHLGDSEAALAALEKAYALDPSLPDQEVGMLGVLRGRMAPAME